MFSGYNKILVLSDSEEDITYIIDNVNDNVTILYKYGNNISKYLFKKGIENINFICPVQSIESDLGIIIKIGKPDLIITKIDLDDEHLLLCEENKITIFNFTSKDCICGECSTLTNYLGLTKINKICSDKCIMNEHPEFNDLIGNIVSNKIQSTIEKSFSNSKKNIGTFKNQDQDPVEKKKTEKFQKIALLDAKRHAYQLRKNDYIRSMRSQSNTKEIFDDDLNNNNVVTKPEVLKMCKATTKKEGKACSNKSTKGSEYCGIVGHRKMDPNYKNVKNNKSSSNKKFEKLAKGMKLSFS